MYFQNSARTHGGFEIYYNRNNNGFKSEKRFQCNCYQQYINTSKLLDYKSSHYRVII